MLAASIDERRNAVTDTSFQEEYMAYTVDLFLNIRI